MTISTEHYYVMGTGSRSMRTDPNAQTIYKHLLTKVELLAEQHPNLWMISGMAEGWDEAIAKAAIALGIPFTAAIPNDTYGAYYWGRNSVTGKDRINDWYAIIGQAREVVIVCNSIKVDGVHSNFIRNQWMVDHSDHALVYAPQSSGTRDALARLVQAQESYEVYPFILQEELAL